MVTTHTVCGCGKSKAERAVKCFDCLAIDYKPKAYVKTAIGEPGPKFYGVRADGTIRRFARHSEATEWIGAA